MRVQQVTAPMGGVSWTVIGSDLRQVDPVEQYLAWLSAIERSPNTVRAYALDLKTFWVFLEDHGIRVGSDQLGAARRVHGVAAAARGERDRARERAPGAVLVDGEPDVDGGVRVLRVPRPQRR